MLLKTIGIALTIGCSGVYGMMGARRLEKRAGQLKQLRLAMNFLEKEITCMNTPLAQALMRTAKFSPSPVNLFFLETSSQLHGKRGLTSHEAWSRGLEKLHRESSLREEDLDLLGSMVAQIGLSHTDEQKKLFNLIQEELRIQEGKSLAEVEAGRKLWVYGGFILGTMVVILLI
ncbi:MAG: hypothetical protein ACOX6I_04825 [Syntrophomonadaceae bacterium]|jgi:stage III sporulation protein AB